MKKKMASRLKSSEARSVSLLKEQPSSKSGQNQVNEEVRNRTQ